MNDHEAALAEIQHDIDRLRTNLEGVCLRQDLPDKGLIEWAAHLLEIIENYTSRGLIG